MPNWMDVVHKNIRDNFTKILDDNLKPTLCYLTNIVTNMCESQGKLTDTVGEKILSM